MIYVSEIVVRFELFASFVINAVILLLVLFGLYGVYQWVKGLFP